MTDSTEGKGKLVAIIRTKKGRRFEVREAGRGCDGNRLCCSDDMEHDCAGFRWNCAAPVDDSFIPYPHCNTGIYYLEVKK